MHQVAAFFIGLASSTVGAIAAGGGLISIPGLIFLGVPPISAVATTRLNVISGGITAVYRYRQDNKVLWKYMPQFLILGLVAGIIGSRLLLDISQTAVQRTLGVILLVMLPLFWIRKDLGLTNVKRSKRRHLIGLPVTFVVLVYSTMFGGGGGVFLIYAFVYFFGMTITEANATGFVVSIFATLVALVSFINGHAVNWSLGLPAMTGALFGGYLGANLAIKKGVAWVKLVLTLVIIGSAVKLLF